MIKRDDDMTFTISSTIEDMLSKVKHSSGTEPSATVQVLFIMLNRMLSPEMYNPEKPVEGVSQEFLTQVFERNKAGYEASKHAKCLQFCTGIYGGLYGKAVTTEEDTDIIWSIALDTTTYYAYDSTVELVKAMVRGTDFPQDGPLSFEEENNLSQLCHSIWNYHRENPGIDLVSIVWAYIDSRPAASTEVISEDAVNELRELASTANILIPLARAGNKIPEIAIAGDLQRVRVDADGKVSIKAAVSGEDGGGVTITPFEIGISNAVGQLMWENKQDSGALYLEATPSQIYRAFAGMNPGEAVSPEIQEQVAAVLDKCMTLRTTIDFTEQVRGFTRLRLNKDVEVDNYKITRPFIPCGRTDRTYKYKGQLVKEQVYEFYRLPPFFQYSLAINQIGSFPKILLNPPKVKKGTAGYVESPVAKSPDNVTLEQVLLKEINFMESTTAKNKKQPYIRVGFDTLATHAGLDVSTRQRYRTFKDNVRRALLQFVAGKGLAYAEEYKVGRKWAGISLWRQVPTKPSDPEAWNTKSGSIKDPGAKKVEA